MDPSAYPKDEDPSMTAGSLERHAPHHRALTAMPPCTRLRSTMLCRSLTLALGHQVGHPEALTELGRARIVKNDNGAAAHLHRATMLAAAMSNHRNQLNNLHH